MFKCVIYVAKSLDEISKSAAKSLSFHSSVPKGSFAPTAHEMVDMYELVGHRIMDVVFCLCVNVVLLPAPDVSSRRIYYFQPLSHFSEG